MGCNVAKPKAQPKPGVSSNSQATRTNQNYFAQADRPSDLMRNATSHKQDRMAQMQIDQKLEGIRVKLEYYKHLYDAGLSLPPGSDYDICPNSLINNTVYKDKVVEWMLEYKVPELFKRTLDSMTSSTFHSDQRVYNTYNNILHCLNNILAFSKRIAERLIELNYIERFVQILSDPQFTENQQKMKYLLDGVLGSILNCVSHIPGHLIYKQSKLAEALKPYLANRKLKAAAMMIYSSVIGEDESKQLDDSGCIPFMIEGINAAIHSPDRRVHVDSSSFSINGLLECVTRIAANDVNKIKMVELGLLPLIVKSLQGGNHKEIEISAKLVWTLCFDEETKKKVINEPGLVNELERLSESSNKEIKKAAKGAVWKISGEEKHQQEAKQQSQQQDQQQDQQQAQQQTYEKGHIFISYQWDDQPMILQLNERLKADGYTTWIDVEQMGGSTLDAMAAAVENAALVLICASEKYKLSPNCRTEGHYTHQLKKVFVPLMMQLQYKPDGWLGALMGTSLYINFDGMSEFEKAYQMLMKEMKPKLNGAMKPEMDREATIMTQATSMMYSTSQVSQLTLKSVSLIDSSAWSHQQVVEWATRHNLTQLSSEFSALLERMDGKILQMFCEKEKKSPEFFNQQMENRFKLDLEQIMSLNLAMKELQ